MGGPKVKVEGAVNNLTAYFVGPNAKIAADLVTLAARYFLSGLRFQMAFLLSRPSTPLPTCFRGVLTLLRVCLSRRVVSASGVVVRSSIVKCQSFKQPLLPFLCQWGAFVYRLLLLLSLIWHFSQVALASTSISRGFVLPLALC